MDKKSLKLIAVGDLFMGEHPVTSGHGVDTIVNAKGANFPFEHVSSSLNGGDIVLGNLEGVISDLGRDPKNFISNCFRGSPQVAEALSLAGFTALSLANNHTMQHDRAALYDTMTLLDKNNINYTGIKEGSPAQSKVIYIKKNGLQVAVLGYCKSQQYHLDDPILCQGTYDNITFDIARIRDDVDFVILTLHWGNEFTDKPSPAQVRLGRQLIDAGVDLIIGHHSHVLQGIEKYKKGVIVYSLGSFVKDLWPENMRESIIFQCELSSTGVTNLSYTPIFINDAYQPEIVSGGKAKAILGRLHNLSAVLEQEDLSSFEKKEEQYNNFVKKLLKKDRRDTYVHYLTNFFRYDPVMLFRNFWLVITRRLVKKNI